MAIQDSRIAPVPTAVKSSAQHQRTPANTFGWRKFLIRACARDLSCAAVASRQKTKTNQERGREGSEAWTSIPITIVSFDVDDY